MKWEFESETKCTLQTHLGTFELEHAEDDVFDLRLGVQGFAEFIAADIQAACRKAERIIAERCRETMSQLESE